MAAAGKVGEVEEAGEVAMTAAVVEARVEGVVLIGEKAAWVVEVTAWVGEGAEVAVGVVVGAAVGVVVGAAVGVVMGAAVGQVMGEGVERVGAVGLAADAEEGDTGAVEVMVEGDEAVDQGGWEEVESGVMVAEGTGEGMEAGLVVGLVVGTVEDVGEGVEVGMVVGDVGEVEMVAGKGAVEAVEGEKVEGREGAEGKAVDVAGGTEAVGEKVEGMVAGRVGVGGMGEAGSAEAAATVEVMEAMEEGA